MYVCMYVCIYVCMCVHYAYPYILYIRIWDQNSTQTSQNHKNMSKTPPREVVCTQQCLWCYGVIFRPHSYRCVPYKSTHASCTYVVCTHPLVLYCTYLGKYVLSYLLLHMYVVYIHAQIETLVHEWLHFLWLGQLYQGRA